VTTSPLVLLPVRIETAFADGQLLIRVYPDEIHLDRRSPAPPVGESRPRAPVRARWLPARWVAVGWSGGQRRFLVEGAPIDAEHIAISPDFESDDPEREMRWMFDLAEAERAGMALRVQLDTPQLDRLLVFGLREGSTASGDLVELLDAHRVASHLEVVAPGTPTNRVGVDTASVAPVAGDVADRAGARIATALGAPGADILISAPGADRDEETVARAMATALWSATWGYFLTSMMHPVEMAQEELDHARAHFIQHVRAGGPLATLRLGQHPYSILPTTSLDRWKPDPSDLTGLAGLLARLRTVWRSSASRPASGAGLVEAMKTAPYSQGLGARSLLGRRYVANLFEFLGVSGYPQWAAREEQLGTEAFTAVGLDWKPRIAHTVFDGDSFELRGPLVDPLVAMRHGFPHAGGALVGVNYVEWVRDAEVAELRRQVKIPRLSLPIFTAGGPRPRRDDGDGYGLFYSVLRHGMLRAYADTAARVMKARSGGVAWAGVVEPELAGDGFSSGSSPTVWQLFDGHLPRDHRTDAPTIGEWVHTALTPDTTMLVEHRASLTVLAHQPLAVLERHFAGVLDLCSYRLDAWITSVASRRLAALRVQDPSGLVIGSYGWLEDLRPRQAATESEGFVLAPSVALASTAAILRSGYRGRRLRAEDAGALAIDLSSQRVRGALAVLDGVRRGLGLGAQLGAHFERSLHDAGLDRFIARFRRLAPPQEGVVVDGEKLLELWREPRDFPGFDWGDARDALVQQLDGVLDVVDALGDVTVAEGVHLAVRGQHEQASAVFDAIGRGEQPPPVPSVTSSPRRAVRHTARLLVGLPSEPIHPVGWAPAAHALRGEIAPALDAWAGQLLGDPSKVKARATWTGGASVDVSLAQLGLSALDVVYLEEMLESLMLSFADRARPQGATGSPVLDRARVGTSTTVDELRALARSMRAVLDRARGAKETDLVHDPAPVADVDPALAAHVTTVRNALNARLEIAATDPVAGLLGLAVFGIADADLAAAISVARARLAAAIAARDPGAMLAALLGAPLPIPRTVALPAEVQASVAARGAPDLDALTDWTSGVGRVRDAVGRFDDLLLLSRAFGRAGDFRYAQLPHAAEEPAIFAAAMVDRPHLALVIHAPLPPSGTSMAALIVDEWVETVPLAEETGGVGFHFDRPNAEPPQAILLAIPPDVGAPWAHDTIESVLLETLDLAAIRTASPESLGVVAQIVPAAVFAFNAAGDTITTDFTPLAE
jgi:hypothetical protein